MLQALSLSGVPALLLETLPTGALLLNPLLAGCTLPSQLFLPFSAFALQALSLSGVPALLLETLPASAFLLNPLLTGCTLPSQLFLPFSALALQALSRLCSFLSSLAQLFPVHQPARDIGPPQPDITGRLTAACASELPLNVASACKITLERELSVAVDALLHTKSRKSRHVDISEIVTVSM